jgi:NADH:ubiquinone oxidoreductase subunit 2 (subunit N)
VIPSTPYLLLGPLVLFLPLYLVRRAKPWAGLAAAAALALTAYGCLHLPPDEGMVLFERTFALDGLARMALAWIAGGAALLAAGHAIAGSDSSPAVFLLPAVSAAGLALAVEPFPLALLAVWIAMLVAMFLFRPEGAGAARGVSQFIVLTAVSLPAFLAASILLARALTASMEEIPPWGIIAVLFVIGSVAWLSLVPFHAWGPGLMGAGQPMSGGWVVGILQPLALFTFVRVLLAHPDLAAEPLAQQIALVAAAASAALGAVFAATTQHPGRMLGYTALAGIAPLFAVLYASAGVLSPFHWMAVLGYSAGVVLASVGLAGIQRGGQPGTLAGLAGAARERGAALALLLCAALGLCGLPLGVGFWTHGALRPDMPAMPANALLVFQIAPLAAAFGWWRVLRAATRGREGEPVALGRTASAVFWALAAAAVMLVVWPWPLSRLAEALARAFGSP